MSDPKTIDDVLVKWGERLFYPRVRFQDSRTPRLALPSSKDRAAYFRARIEATMLRRAPQVMVKVTGGGRGMKAIAAHFRYISKHGKLEMEDEFGRRSTGKEAVNDVLDEWRIGGTAIDDVGFRREALNIMLSMPSGTDPGAVVTAARAFAKAELMDHRYVMVLHDHQANPHVHLSVRAESKRGLRLSPRKADLHRWREVFAEKLRELGIDAEATRQGSRGEYRNHPAIWRVKAAGEGRPNFGRPNLKSGSAAIATRRDASRAWIEIAAALSTSAAQEDQRLAESIRRSVIGPRNLGRDQPRHVPKDVRGPSVER